MLRCYQSSFKVHTIKNMILIFVNVWMKQKRCSWSCVESQREQANISDMNAAIPPSKMLSGFSHSCVSPKGDLSASLCFGWQNSRRRSLSPADATWQGDFVLVSKTFVRLLPQCLQLFLMHGARFHGGVLIQRESNATLQMVDTKPIEGGDRNHMSECYEVLWDHVIRQ